jgi:hypothetical protein
MAAKLNLGLLAMCAFGFAGSALGQDDAARFASGLRAKYGPPLARETFAARPGIEMVVNYAANGHVCKIELPPIAPEGDSGVQTPKVVDDFVAELVPSSVRGRELRQGPYVAMSTISMRSVEYENVTISELRQGPRRTAVTVTFKREACPLP